MGRFGLCRARCCDPRASAICAGLYQQERRSQSAVEPRRQGEESNQVTGQGESRTPVSGTEANLRLQKGSISRPGQECQSTVCCLRISEYIHGAQTIIAANIGQVRLKFTGDPKTGRSRKLKEQIESNAEHFPNLLTQNQKITSIHLKIRIDQTFPRSLSVRRDGMNRGGPGKSDNGISGLQA